MAKKEITQAEIDAYYDACLEHAPALRNKMSRRVWFEETAPKDGLPNHHRIISCLRVKQANDRFFARLKFDVLRNGRAAWSPGMHALPDKTQFSQPLDVCTNLDTLCPTFGTII